MKFHCLDISTLLRSAYLTVDTELLNYNYIMSFGFNALMRIKACTGILYFATM